METKYKVNKFTKHSYVINAYLREISKFPVLSHKQEMRLIDRARNGEDVARTILINCNLRLAFQESKKYDYGFVPFEDIYSLANIGLVQGINKAIEIWDSNLGFKLMSYVITWVHQSIKDGIPGLSNLVRLPNSVVYALRLKKKIIDSVNIHEGERIPLNDEIRQLLLAQDKQLIPEMMDYKNEVFFFSQKTHPYNNTDNCITYYFIDEWACPYGPDSTEYFLDQDSFIIDITRILDRLPEKESSVISFYYGLNYKQNSERSEFSKKLSLEDIGCILGLSVERIRQIRDKALKNLRKGMYARVLEKHLK